MSSIKKNYTFNLILTVVNLIFPIVSFPYASRILGPVGIGQVQFITSFAQYFALVAALGIPIYGVREIAKAQKNREQLSKTFSELMIIFIATSVIVSLIYLIIIFKVSRFKVDISSYYASVSVILLGFFSLDWFYSGIEKFKIIAVRSVAIKLVSLVLLYVFVKTKSDVFIFLLINLFSIAGNNLISGAFVWKEIDFTTKQLNFRRHFKALLLIFSTSLASSMYTILDVVLLGFLANKEAVGYYSAGVKLVKITIPFVTSLGAVMLPKISFNLDAKNYDEFYSILTKSFAFIAFIAVPISFGLFLLSREGILIFSGDEFAPAQKVMQVLALMPIVIGFGYFFGIQILISSGKDKEMLISVALGMIASLALNFIFVPALKESGAAIANIVSEAVVTGAYIYFAQKHFSFKIPYMEVINAFLSALIFIPIIWISKLLFSNMVVYSIAAVLVCILSYVLIQLYAFKNTIVMASFNTVVNKLKKV